MAFELLTYLTRRPDAQDTFEGILQWWVVARDVPRSPREVRGAVDELVAAGLLVAAHGRDRQERYQLNPARKQAAQELVRFHAGRKGS
jgi:hypothetical protein